MRHQRFSILEKQKVVDEIRKSVVQKGGRDHAFCSALYEYTMCRVALVFLTLQTIAGSSAVALVVVPDRIISKMKVNQRLITQYRTFVV